MSIWRGGTREACQNRAVPWVRRDCSMATVTQPRCMKVAILQVPAVRSGGGVGGDTAVGGAPGGLGRRAARDVGRVPALPGLGEEPLALGRPPPLDGLPVVGGHGVRRRAGDGPGGEVAGQRGERDVVPEPDRAWAELGPAFVVDVRGVLQLEARAAVGLGGEAHLDPADVAVVLPCDVEALRRVALLDGAGRVALDLVAPA